jgi:hypothetical protein
MANQLGVDIAAGGKSAQGCCTPKEDKSPQKMSVPPKRVLPIIFLPGIMGSNLRMSASRQRELKKTNNISWRPDNLGASSALLFASAADRQNQLDPLATEVDIYDPEKNSTGNPSETADQRHDLGTVHVYLNVGVETSLLSDDPKTQPNRKTKEQKARERGWGEVYFESYRSLLESCEKYLNQFFVGKFWRSVFDIEPSEWRATASPMLKPLSEAECKKALAGCWFPVHAMGYNWLSSNRISAVEVSGRIRTLVQKYRSQGYQCEKVVIVTHSMGGLVGRALIHPEIGGLEDDVLGIVHGAMPAMGAPAAYKRMRCGFEEGFAGLDVAPKVLGNYGSEVTAVLGNAQGGLELLPSRAYGNDWLEMRQNGVLLRRLPSNGDPYSEIYQVQGKWFSLLKDEWLNPAQQPGLGFAYTCNLLKRAGKFHDDINASYHKCSYALYSAEATRPSWERVTWNLDKNYRGSDWAALVMSSDKGQGKFKVREPQSREGAGRTEFSVTLGPSVGPGDQTVPARSADHQLVSGKFSGIFRQIGYEHQSSYDDAIALKSTLFSLVRIIETMRWSEHA